MGTPNEFKGLQCPPRPGDLLLTKMLMAGRGSDADRTKVPAVQPPPTPPLYSTFSQPPPTAPLVEPPLPFCGIGIGWAL
ncbi:hypothetical protein C4D60_Mb02t20820 [Musa balbisiana]|uniref:Uncharacterized protein n=1 Tax=Musa balbisiana TaxID=52838 RepID=A0A4V4H2U2_MUSBA|nr:hypothetical protein C4D60_Mb02t20820 [Musa balbisiana]